MRKPRYICTPNHAIEHPERVAVFREYGVWLVARGDETLPDDDTQFDTHAEAITYADKTARETR